RVRDQLLVAPAEQLPQRDAERLAERVPDRDLDGPRPAAVEVDRLADLADDLGALDVDTGEQPLAEGPGGQPVAARRPPGAPLGGVDEDGGRLLLRPRHWIPGGSKRRVERVPVDAGLDPGDPHVPP